ncbi:MAG: glycoside hydrolase family 97 protein [Bacteroidia bacterium]|nr:glycoside hydrolase family 97 protein [Bacteroidia bacterium]
MKLNIPACLLLFATLALLSACGGPKDVQIQSPDEKLILHFHLTEQGEPTYKLTFGKQPLILPSPLGFEFKDAPALKDNLEIVLIRESRMDEPWQPRWGENLIVENKCNRLELILHEKDSPERILKMEFRLYNDGLGFRYTLEKNENWTSVQISNELTGFHFAEDPTAWWIPADYDSYEHLYTQSPLSQAEAVNTPLTCKNADGTHFSLHEAALLNYAGMTLKKSPEKPNFWTADLVPWPDGVKVRAELPLTTPWRTIQVSHDAAGLLKSNLIANLNEPCKIDSTQWIKPIKYVGIWWGLHIGTQTWVPGPRHGASTQNIKSLIDFAAENQINGVLAEGWNTGWESWGQDSAFDFTTPTADLNLPEVADYAREKGISYILHHETGGDAPWYEARLDSAFGLAQSLGVHYIKTGYAGAIRPVGQHHHGQWMVNHYQKVVETAARYQICLDVHEPIKPTGLHRTWPNLMTGEGVRGMEWNAWSKGNPPGHTCIIPFTRGLAGPIDYTPGIFDLLLEKSPGRIPPWEIRDGATPRVHTTLAKQLALLLINYSPMQMAADLPENYRGQPAFKFISDLPPRYTETRILQAEIGDYLTLARRHDQEWFLAAITDEVKRSQEFKLDFLEPNQVYLAEIYRDAENSDWQHQPTQIVIEKAEVRNTDYLRLFLGAGGGAAVRFVPKK